MRKKVGFVFNFTNRFGGSLCGVVAATLAVNDCSAPLLLGYSARVVGGTKHVVEVTRKATEAVTL